MLNYVHKDLNVNGFIAELAVKIDGIILNCIV